MQLSASQVYRLVTEKPERLSLSTLAALVEILGCAMEELIEVVPKATAVKKTAGARDRRKPVRTSDIGAHRPIRAKIVDADS